MGQLLPYCFQYYFHMNIYCPPSFPLSKIYHGIAIFQFCFIFDIDLFLDADNMADNQPVDDSDDDEDDEVAQVKKKVSIRWQMTCILGNII